MLVKTVTGSAGLRIAGMGFGFLVGVQLARGLGAEGYGIYGVAMSIIALLTVPTEFGLPQLLTREVAVAKVKRDWDRMKGILCWSSMVSLLISAVIGVGVVAWLLLSGHGLGSPLGMTLLAGVLMVPIVAQLSMHSATLRGLQLIVRGQLPDVLLRPMLHSALLFLALLGWIPMTPAVAMVLGLLSTVIALAVALHMLRRSMPDEVYAASAVVDARGWWASALPMALTEGMRLLQSHLLILLLGAMVAMSEVGVYRVASSVMLLIAMPISLFNVIGMPVIAKLYSAGETGSLQRLLGLTSAGMTLGTLMLCAPFFIAGEWLLGTVFGTEFVAGNSTLLILSLSILANAAFGTAAVLLNMTGHQGEVARASLLSLACLATTAVPLVHYAGIRGAALSHLVSTIIWNLYMWRVVRSRLSLDSSLLSLCREPRREGL